MVGKQGIEQIRVDVAAVQAEVDNIDGDAIPAMVGTNSAALASVLGAQNTGVATGAISDAKAAMAYLKQRVTQGVSCMTFSSASKDVNCPIIVIPGTGADLDFPSVTVEGLPTGANILRADMALVIGGLLDTSTAENQIKTGTSDLIQVKVSTGAWVTNDIPCLEFEALGLQVGASAYGSGAVLWGAIDIKSVVTGNETYNFRSVETTTLKGVESTGGGLELLDVSIVIRVWFT